MFVIKMPYDDYNYESYIVIQMNDNPSFQNISLALLSGHKTIRSASRYQRISIDYLNMRPSHMMAAVVP